ncbi:M20/M25/M40 family metallo-hydrolase [candidate division KSB1 bacterium]|nr:M20/M25/M40 family metallo-hydrolase [candidate division KSB1 bacterium]
MDFSKLKNDVISFIDGHEKEQLDFLIRLCNQNSYTFNSEGVNLVAEMIVDQLNGILSVHQIEKFDKVGNSHIFRTGDFEKSIYLAGHLDTVFPKEHAFQTCSIKGDILNGPGTGDMKGGLVVIIYALKALKNAGILDDIQISVIFNSDEEIGSKYSQKIMERERKKAITCLVAECAGINNSIVISRNGKMGARMKSFGKSQHVSVGTHEKSSAIIEIARKIIDIESLNNIYPGVSLNIGKVNGGLGPATIAAEAEAYIDIRWEHEEHKKKLVHQIESIIKQQVLAGCHSEFEILNSRPSMPFTGLNQNLVNTIQSIGKKIGQDVPTEHRRGTSDANYFGSANVPTIDGLGPISEWDHTENEYIKMSSFYDRTRLLALLMIKLAEDTGALA